MNPLRPLPRNPTKFGVLGAAAFQPGLKGKKQDEAYLKDKLVKVQDAVEDPISEVITGPHTARPATPEERKSGKIKSNQPTPIKMEKHVSDKVDARFGSEPDAMFKISDTHHGVLIQHGYKRVGVTRGQYGVDEHHYKHPRTGDKVKVVHDTGRDGHITSTAHQMHKGEVLATHRTPKNLHYGLVGYHAGKKAK